MHTIIDDQKWLFPSTKYYERNIAIHQTWIMQNVQHKINAGVLIITSKQLY